MANKNQILVFIVSFLIGGFFLLSTPEAEAGTPASVCCAFGSPRGDRCAADAMDCTGGGGTVCESEFECDRGDPCTCPTPEIPTLNQYGMIIMAAVLGLFAVISLFVMRRGSVVKPGG